MGAIARNSFNIEPYWKMNKYFFSNTRKRLNEIVTYWVKSILIAKIQVA
jgi:hypothetical protein